MKKIISFLLLCLLINTYSFADTLVNDSIVHNDTIDKVVNEKNDSANVSAYDENATNNIKPELNESNGISINSVGRGALGMLVLIFIAFLLSENRKKINWKVVLIGLGIQILMAVLILNVEFVQIFFHYVSKAFVQVINFTFSGTEFLFKAFETGAIEMPLMNFAVVILPTIIFFSALTSILFYFGIIQKIVYVFAWLMTKLFRLSGANRISFNDQSLSGKNESI